MSFTSKRREFTRVPHDDTDFWNSVRNDKQSGVDFVLVRKKEAEMDNKETIELFEKSLRRQGLQLKTHREGELYFTKIYAHLSSLKHYCEIMKLRMPVSQEHQKNLVEAQQRSTDYSSSWKNFLTKMMTRYLPEKPYKVTEEYTKSRSFLFDANESSLFSLSDRCMIVHFILERARFTNDPSSCDEFGISKLLDMKIYLSAYPPHDGMLTDETSTRSLLAEEWATWGCLFRYQPLDQIKDYFGMKCALYFAWLGFYTHSLLLPSALSLLFLLYGVYTWNSDHLSREICESAADLVMCPQCDHNCDYWQLGEACWYYKLRYLIDNDLTPVYVFVMSVWNVIYLKRWRRYSAKLKHCWGLRQSMLYPETLRQKTSVCIPVDANRPRVYRAMKLPCIFLTYTVVLFLVLVASGCVAATVLYSMIMIASQLMYNDVWTKYHRPVLVPVTSAILYYVIISILNLIYDMLMKKLTKFELHRTQTEFDNSLYLKMYVFQFVNYYFIFFYMVFIKGKLIGHPGAYIRVLGYRQEECEPGGCLMEICIQILVFMVVEQLRDNIYEYVWPLVCKSWARCPHTSKLRKLLYCMCACCRNKREQPERWLEDFKLNSWSGTTLFQEYLEIVIQFGYIAIFTVACPLAPILALFNNFLLEIRLDAKKFLELYQRPIAQRVPDIGIWSVILDTVTKLSIFTNAWIIASTTNWIPVWMYRITVSNYTSAGFIDFSLAHFDVEDLEKGSAPARSEYNVSACRYIDYRHPPDADNKYEKSLQYWHILVARLVFIIVYHALVSAVVTVIEWWLRDMPSALARQIEKEQQYILNKMAECSETSSSSLTNDKHYSHA